jgi:hypothetical protein
MTNLRDNTRRQLNLLRRESNKPKRSHAIGYQHDNTKNPQHGANGLIRTSQGNLHFRSRQKGKYRTQNPLAKAHGFTSDLALEGDHPKVQIENQWQHYPKKTRPQKLYKDQFTHGHVLTFEAAKIASRSS